MYISTLLFNNYLKIIWNNLSIYQLNKPRPLIITFNSISEAFNIMKNKIKLLYRYATIPLSSDCTQYQRDYMKKLRGIGFAYIKRRNRLNYTICKRSTNTINNTIQKSVFNNIHNIQNFFKFPCFLPEC